VYPTFKEFFVATSNAQNIKYMNKIISFYCKKYESEVQEMRVTSHHLYDGQTIVNHNPWHGEGDVWAHVTAMLGAYKAYLSYNTIKIESVEDLMTMTVAILTHDYGKVFTRKIKDDNKVTFYNHAFMSTKHASNVVYDVLAEFCVDTDKQSSIIVDVCDLVSNHMVFYDLINIPDKLAKMVRYESSLYNKFKLFKEIDELGSVASKDSDSHKSKHVVNINFTGRKYTKSNLTSDDVDIMFYCGLPGSGKDFRATQADRKIFSFDIIRERVFKDNLSSDLNSRVILNDPKEVAKQAFEYCLSKNTPLEQLLIEDINNEISINGFRNKIAVCNTNLKKDNRRVILNYLKNRYRDVTIGCTFIILNEDTCKLNDRNRTDHTVGEETFKIMKRIEIPTYNENFDGIWFKTSYDAV
jgi:hypothetical protein